MNLLPKSLIASLFLILIFGTVTSLVSGPAFMISQFLKFWPYLVTLSIGFGVQVWLFLALKANAEGLTLSSPDNPAQSCRITGSESFATPPAAGSLRTAKLASFHPASRAIVATTGSSSTLAMIACCSHYLVTFLPFLGVTGIATIVGQYQIEIFFIGILMNFVGIGILLNKYLFPSSSLSTP